MTEPTMTGPERPLTGRVEPANDEVIAVFRNGKLIDIWDSGTRARALWLKYRPGSLTYARVLRSDIRFDSRVPSVLVADDWLLPMVKARTFVALNSANQYAALRRRIDQRGLGFAEALSAQIHGEMNDFVRSLFAGRTHAEVMSNPSPKGFGAGTVLLDGLFVVDSVHVISAEADPQYHQLRTAEQGKKVDVVEDERAEALAARRGLTLHDYENPQLIELRLQQQHELTLAAGAQHIELEKLRVEATRDQLQLQQTEITAQSDVNKTIVENITAVTRAQKSGALPDFTLGLRGAAAPNAGDSTAADFTPTIPAPVDELARDPRLLTAWKRAGGPSRALKGAVRVEEDGCSLVVLALDHSSLNGQDVPVLSGQAFPGDDVFVLPQSDSLLTWVDDLVHDRSPRITDLQPVMTLEEHDDTLRILVGSQAGRSGIVVKAILDPTTLIVPSLCALLPYEDVTCEPALM